MSDSHAANLRTTKSPLDLYLIEIQQDALLNASEEAALARSIAAGDKAARTRMIQANLRLVVRIARDYIGRGLSLEDLIGEGNLGLIRAAEEYNPDYGTRFSTYAGYWIKQAIRHALTNTTVPIRLPSHMVGLLTKWRRTERLLSRELGQPPSEEQIAVQLGLTDAQFEMARRARQASRFQFESGFAGDGNSWSPNDAPDDRDTPDSRLEAADDHQLLLRRLDRLDERERLVLSLRYGLEGNAPQTLKEVGRRLGVTREWVRKIELRAVRKLEEGESCEPAPPISRRNGSSPRFRGARQSRAGATG